MCSYGFLDRTAAVVDLCMPRVKQEESDSQCGDYLIDLTEADNQTRNVKTFPMGTGCTYRVYSSCGYPTAQVRIPNPKYAKDFYIAYSSIELPLERDFDWDYSNLTTEWSGSLNSNASNLDKPISEGYNKNFVFDESVLTLCDGPPKSMYLIIARRLRSQTEPLTLD